MVGETFAGCRTVWRRYGHPLLSRRIQLCSLEEHISKWLQPLDLIDFHRLNPKSHLNTPKEIPFCQIYNIRTCAIVCKREFDKSFRSYREPLVDFLRSHHTLKKVQLFCNSFVVTLTLASLAEEIFRCRRIITQIAT